MIFLYISKEIQWRLKVWCGTINTEAQELGCSNTHVEAMFNLLLIIFHSNIYVKSINKHLMLFGIKLNQFIHSHSDY